MAVALIQGASRGLGLQFSKVLSSRPDVSKVIATSRGAENEAALLEIQRQYPNKLALVNIDVTKEEDIKKSVAAITEKSGGKIDLLVNCSAILHPSGKGETSLRDVSAEVTIIIFLYSKIPKFLKIFLQGLRRTFETNTIGPLLIAKYFSPLLLKGSGMLGSQSDKKHSSLFVNITAKVSSISGKIISIK